MSFKKIKHETWKCDTCGQEYSGNIHYHSVSKLINDEDIGIYYTDVECPGTLRKIE